MPGKLTDAVKSARSTILIRESNERKRAFEAWYDGKTVNVLTEDTEEVDGRLYTVGYTPEYVKVFMPETDSGKITEILCFDAGCVIIGR